MWRTAGRGSTNLFAAFNIAIGEVISELHRQHRAIEFKKSLSAIDKNVIVCDNYGTCETDEIRATLRAGA